MVTLLRDGLPPVPARMSHLPVDARGYPVPFFVEWIEGKPDFRVADGRKLARCMRENRCWICGEVLGAFKSFVIGPMCAINRTISEPPQHYECSVFSAIACPFMILPRAKRRESNLPAEAREPGGVMLKRNPGAVAVWTTRHFRVIRDDRNLPLWRLGEPTHVEWFAEGRTATRAEVEHSINTGLPLLEEIAASQGSEAIDYLALSIRVAQPLLPAA